MIKELDNYGITYYKGKMKVRKKLFFEKVDFEDNLNLGKRIKDKEFLVEKVFKTDFDINKILIELDTIKEDSDDIFKWLESKEVFEHTYLDDEYIGYRNDGPARDDYTGAIIDDDFSDDFDSESLQKENWEYDSYDDEPFISDIVEEYGHDVENWGPLPKEDYNIAKKYNSIVLDEILKLDEKFESIEKAYVYLSNMFDKNGLGEIAKYLGLAYCGGKIPKTVTNENRILLEYSGFMLQVISLEDVAVCNEEYINKKIERNYKESMIHLLASKFEGLLIKFANYFGVSKENQLSIVMSRKNFIDYAQSNLDVNIKEVEGYLYVDKLYSMWNLVKHNSNSAYGRLERDFPNTIKKQYSSDVIFGVDYIRINKWIYIDLHKGLREFIINLYENITKDYSKDWEYKFQMFFLGKIFDDEITEREESYKKSVT